MDSLLQLKQLSLFMHISPLRGLSVRLSSVTLAADTRLRAVALISIIIFVRLLYRGWQTEICIASADDLCRICDAGLKCPSVGLGSTPTASQPSVLMKQITELHPGNYIFYGLIIMVSVVRGSRGI